MSGFVTITNPDSEIIDGVDLDDLPPAYDGPADKAHTVLEPGEYMTTTGLTLLVTDSASEVLAPRRFISLDSGDYALLNDQSADHTWNNIGYTPSGDWADFAPIEGDAVGPHEEEWLTAIAAALAAAIYADFLYAIR